MRSVAGPGLRPRPLESQPGLRQMQDTGPIMPQKPVPLPACPDALETENPGWEPGWGALPRALWHLGGLSQEILQLWGFRLAPASRPWAEEGQGQGPGELCPGGRMYRNSVPCSVRACGGKWAFLSFTVCPAPAKSNNRDLPTSHT